MTSTRARLFVAVLSAVIALHPGIAAATPPSSPAAPQVLSVEDCLRIAVEKNRRSPASRVFTVAMAEAQHRQALAGYWPHIRAKAGWFRLDGLEPIAGRLESVKESH